MNTEEKCKCNAQDETNECKCGEECHCEPEKKEKKGKVKQELQKLQDKNKKLAEEVLIAKADLINYRKRKDEEVTRMLKFANEDLVKELLPVVDNFERAIKMDDEDLTDEVSKFLSGVKMIYCSFIGSMEKYGVKAIDGINKPFDPTFHQAVMTEKRENVEPGIVIEVLQKGYLLKDKVIRPAMVRVSE